MSHVSPSDWIKGVGLSVTASIIGGASKLAIRKSWIMLKDVEDYVSRCHQETTIGMSLQHSPSSAASEEAGFVSHKINHVERGSTVEISHHYHETETPVLIKPFVESALSPVTIGKNGNTTTDVEPSVSHDRYSHYDLSDLKFKNIDPNQIQSIEQSSKILRLSGMVGMTFLNPLCCVLAMQYASPSILAPFSGLTLVWIVLFSEFILGEKPTSVQIRAASWIIAGEVIVAVFGDHTNDDSVGSLDDITNAYKDVYFVTYMIGITVWMMIIFYWIFVLPYSKSSSPFVTSKNAAITRFLWGVSGGSITGLQNFLKDTLTVIKVCRVSHTPIPIALTLTFFLSAIGSAFVGLLLLTACMKQYDATYSSSMFVGSFVISASIMSATRYRTFENLETFWNFLFYPSGLLVLLWGIYVLATEEQSPKIFPLDEMRGDVTDDDNSVSMKLLHEPQFIERGDNNATTIGQGCNIDETSNNNNAGSSEYNFSTREQSQ
eukprot:CAMPEP_0194400766 /NCGR_PEP_ID=MMETSP0174-20130528/127418_1 /TAXON_ID=216777 /ORGANISM="Proboscia alata, Strain PI-D3" /LENGTH=490 /DNA_ID=CAMNT_0039197361 /DNA_START=8 /DNA_END=1477 /DNA_ORIENTATION=-